MSLLNFMTVEKIGSAEKMRLPNRGNAKPAGESTPDAAGFDATFAAVRRQQKAPVDVPQGHAHKLDKLAAKKPEKSQGEAADKPSEEPSSDAPPTADACTHDASQDDARNAQDGDTETTDNANDKSPDGSEAVVVTDQKAPTPQPQAVAKSINAPTDAPAADPAAKPTHLDANATAGKAVAAAKAAAPKVASTESQKSPDEGDATEADADASEKLPAIATKEAKSHEKQSHAAHANPALSNAAAKEPSPAAPQAPVDGSLAQALASAADGISGQAAGKLEAAPASTDPTAAPNSAQIDAHGKAAGFDSAHAEVAPAAQDSPRPEGSDTFDQVVLGLKGKMDARTGKAEIRLDPPNLGTVRVSVTLNDGQLTAEFQSASNVVRDLLRGNLDKLKTALQGQGVTVDRLAVDAPPALPDAGASGQNPQASFGSATHDGRSAGQFREGRPGQQRSAGEGFARVFTQAQDAPLDLVA